MRANEVQMLKEQLHQTDRHQLTVEVKDLKERKDDLMKKVKNCENVIKDWQQKVSSLLK